ncbi:lipopolysaccharide biosynthesis protein [Aerococcus urinaeequi]
MNKSKLLVKNTMIITLSRLSVQFVNFFLLPVYTALLSTAEYGVVDLLNTYVLLLTPIFSLQMESGVFRFLIDERKNESGKKDYISTVFVGVGLQSIVMLFFVGVLSYFFNNQYTFYLLFNILVHVFAMVVLQISRGLGDNFTYGLGNALISISMTILNIIFVVFMRMGADGILIGYFIANLIGIIFIIIRKRLYRYLSFSAVNMTSYKKLLRYSIPLVPNSLSWWMINASDRTIISSFIGIAANGIYAAANKFSSLFISFYNIFNLAWTESATLFIEEEDNEQFFNETINTMFKFFLSLCLGIIAVMPFVFPILINEKFNEAYNHIPILMLSTLCNVVIGLISVVYIALKLTRKVANTSIIAGIINLIVALSLIRFVGLYAASVSTLVSFFSLMILRYIDVQKYLTIKLDRKIVFSSLIMIAILLYTYYQNNLIGNIFSLILIVVYAVIINLNSIGMIFDMIKQKIKK